MFEGLRFDVDTLKEDVVNMKELMKKYEMKIDDLENRSRRNNIVVFNLPEGEEGADCSGFITNLLTTELCTATKY